MSTQSATSTPVPLTGLAYPETPRDNHSDSYFGTKVDDPYRWLEVEDSPRKSQWIAAENKLTLAYLEQIPFRTALRNRLQELFYYDLQSVPILTDEYYIYSRKEGLQNQSIIYLKDRENGKERILLDPNTLSTDGTRAVTQIAISHSSQYMAYTVADAGSDWNSLYVLDIPTGKPCPDVLHWLKFSNIAWAGNGFFYSRYDEPDPTQALTHCHQFHKLYYHKLGEPQEKDTLIFHNPSAPQRNLFGTTSDDEHYLILSESDSTDGNTLYVKDLQNDTPPTQLVIGFQNSYSFVGNIGTKLYFLTNHRAPRYRLLAIDLNAPPAQRNWQEILPETEYVLSDVTLAGKHIVALYCVNVASQIAIYSLTGKKLQNLPLVPYATVTAIAGRLPENTFFYSITSFTLPPTVYAYNLDTQEQKEIFRPKIPFKAADYTVQQQFYPSKDGTQIPLFIIHRNNLQRNGENPTLLYGYGGFNISVMPSFSASRILWLEQGGVLAIANLRGGGEYGVAWHQAGTLLKKQNVFDDFIAAAEFLFSQNYTSPARLAIQGASNGGLLIGAVANQRPELFRVAIPQVGVLDMLRYQYFTIGWAWKDDYGTSTESEEMFRYLYAYSPLHNIQPGKHYPAILVLTAEHDDRVVPAHSFKYIAELQYKQPQGAPKLIRIETKAGHGAGKPTLLAIDELADMYAFIFYNLGVRPTF